MVVIESMWALLIDRLGDILNFNKLKYGKQILTIKSLKLYLHAPMWISLLCCNLIFTQARVLLRYIWYYIDFIAFTSMHF